MLKRRITFIALVCFCLCVGYPAFALADNSNNTQKTGYENQKDEDSSTIGTAERALAMLKVQNTMSKHAYYHAAGKHVEEMNDIWASQDGEYADTVKWSNPMGVWEGWDTVYEFYCQTKLDAAQAALDVISELFPEIENTSENLGIGTEWTIHTQTTPIIEVADDGKTAKGIWYSPGISNSAVIKEDNTVGTSGMWFWEKYGADFVNEDGEWKIWHLQMYYDNGPDGWGDEGEGIGSAVNMPEPTRENPDPYQAWSPTTLMKIQPAFPEPYSTFSETFSY